MRSSQRTLAARYVFPVDAPPIADGRLTIRDGRIAAVGQAKDEKADLDLGNVAILPGFVNAHTHLELSAIARESAVEPENEVRWLRRVVEQRRGRSEEALRAAVERNLAASLRAGTTLIADMTTAGLSWDQIVAAPIRAVVFAELIGLKRARAMETNAAAWNWIGSIPPESQAASRARPGLSPHAPYSTSGWLYEHAAASRLPLSTHLAEMPEELELLETGGGPLRQFLEDLGAWDEEWEPIGPRPADYVRRGELRKADWLIAHGTYLDPEDDWQLRPEAASEGHRVAVAYCPRTHARFGHAPHPYRRLLERGVVVCLGTDSLASNPSLSVLDELRFLHQRDPSLKGPLLLTMATLFGAWALREETNTGTLAIGKSADLAVVALPDRDEDDPHLLLLDSELPVVATMFEGEFVSGRWRGVW
jgi:cytosine/adenosine deaminase-related metal-dependent hydrolase